MISLRRSVKGGRLVAVSAAILLAVIIGVALATEVEIYNITSGFYAYPDERSAFNTLPNEDNGGGIVWNGINMIAGKDDTPGVKIALANYSLTENPIEDGDIIHGYFDLWVDDFGDPPTGVLDDLVFKIGNVNNGVWVSIHIVWPQDVNGKCHLRVKTTGGTLFTSTNHYDWDTTHTVEFKMKVTSAGNGGTVQLKIDGNSEGSATNVEVRQGYDWNRTSHGVISGHRKDLDFHLDNLYLSSDSTLW